MRIQSLNTWVVAFLVTSAECAKLLTIPSVACQNNRGDRYNVERIESITVDTRFATSVDKDGQILIPPTLSQFAETFRNDVAPLVGRKLRLEYGTLPKKNSIFMTIDKNRGKYVDAAKRYTSEGYSLETSKNGIILKGASPLGAWWGTRTIFQALALNGYLPHGSMTDSPGWGSRGVMLDIGRHYYPPEFLVEMCSYLSIWKQNQFHLHINDNLFINFDLYTDKQMRELYSAFRLSSTSPALAGLASPANESYTHAQFEWIQRQCAARGVTIIPEIDAPAHALAITKWKPELALSGNPSMLNISHPGTIPTLKTLWKTFLPWFHTKTVHLGADEYNTTMVSQYNKLVDELYHFVSQSNKKARIWGTFPPSKGGKYTKDVVIQHWAPYEDNAYFDFIKKGYKVLNSDFLFYISSKWHGYFGQTLNKTLIFGGNPEGGAFAPHIFDAKNATNNPPRDSPGVMGYIAAQWSDYGPSASTYLEVYYAWRDGLPALADKAWGGNLSEAEYNSILEKVIANIPGQNLDRRVKSKTDLILDYRFSDARASKSKLVRDTSGNGYDAVNHNCKIRRSEVLVSSRCYLETPLSSKGRDYTLSFWVYPESRRHGELFSGPDSALHLGYGTSPNVTLVSGNHAYSLNYSLPTNIWTHVDLSARGGSTFLKVFEKNAAKTMEFLAEVKPNGVMGSNGVMTIWRPIAIEAPLRRIGRGFVGKMRSISLRGTA
ncbi:putative beta-hexosaminidase [Fusarium oxysporum II5]|uniref:beta-N-acetylhexosaminidase n=2 Tax=Fusarium oxysporum species complex TaxID=171631 RepID=X0IMD4_FUSO5|nr:uncharacterized protein FOIG_16673 [Fusarium odoratissimum NRRL 54006]EXL90058.1 hypothetical protein FOIG_16673 [Fusarium odoratissimum NRRL 54006]KAK2122177.1 putative beta-hexosaminidase [Fusarium oxysporum II5]TVY75282.1 Beta-hexosaminidase [Fusarium oxysporum f. sp. cubense]